MQAAYYNTMAYSNDNGGSFTQQPLTGPTFLREDPYISVGANGTSYAINGACFLPTVACQVSKSSNGGTNWSFATPYDDNSTVWSYQNGTTVPPCNTSGSLLVDYAKITADSHTSSPNANYVYVLGHFVVGAGCSMVVAGVARSTDGGNTWGLHRIISLPIAGWGAWENLVIGSDGTLYYATVDTNLYLVYSTDAGSTWSFSKDTLNLTNAVQRVPLAIASNSTIYFAVSTSGITGHYQIYLIKTSNRGTSFSAPVAISDASSNPFGFTGRNWIAPTITVNPVNSNVFVAWRDWRNSVNDTQIDVYAYSSLIGGSNLRLTPVTGYCRTLNYPGSNTTGANANCNQGNDYLGSASNNYSDFVIYGIDYNAYSSNPTVTQTVSRLTIPRISANPSTVILNCSRGKHQCPSSNSTVTLTGYPTGTTAAISYGCVSSCTNNPFLTGPSTVSVTGPAVSFVVTAQAPSRPVAGTWTLTVTAVDGSINLTTQIQVQVILS